VIASVIVVFAAKFVVAFSVWSPAPKAEWITAVVFVIYSFFRVVAFPVTIEPQRGNDGESMEDAFQIGLFQSFVRCAQLVK
jgi:hypothetical protein